MQFDLRMMAPAGMPKTPGMAVASPGDLAVPSRKFRPKSAGTYTVIGGLISLNGGAAASFVAYVVGDYLQALLDAPELYSDEDSYLPATCTIAGDGGDGYSEVFTVGTIVEPMAEVDGWIDESGAAWADESGDFWL